VSIAIDAVEALLAGRDGLGTASTAAAPPSPAGKPGGSGASTGRVSGSGTGATSPSGDGSMSPRPGSNSAASGGAAGGAGATSFTLCPVSPATITPVVRLTAGPSTVTLPARIDGANVVFTLSPPAGTSPDAFPTGDVSTEVSLDGGATFGPTAGVLKIGKK